MLYLRRVLGGIGTTLCSTIKGGLELYSSIHEGTMKTEKNPLGVLRKGHSRLQRSQFLAKTLL